MRDKDAFVDLCVRELQLCGVHEGEVVAVLTGEERLDYAEAFLSAAARLGAETFQLRVPPASTSRGAPSAAGAVAGTPLASNLVALEALKHSDLVVDLLLMLFSKEQVEIQAAGTRVLLCLEPINKLSQMFPTPDLRRRVEVAEEMLARVESMRVTSAHGTEVTFKLGQYPVLTEYGYTDTPGRWDHWPSGFLCTGARDGAVEGRVVLAPGDILLPFLTYVQSPVEFTIREGRVVSIDGGVDAAILRDYIDGFDDPRAYDVAHIGWGLNERARWSSVVSDPGNVGMESRAFYGNVLFSTGPNQEFGGDNDTPCHLDIPMRGCSLFLDDEMIIKDGQVLVPDMQPGDGASTPA